MRKEVGAALLKHLNLKLGVNYAPLAESQDLRTGLAASLGLRNDAGYTDIAEELLARAHSFLTDVEKKNPRLVLSPIKKGAVSLKPKDMLH